MEILIAEDDKQIVNSLIKNLTEEGHHVRCAYDGEKALYYVKSFPFDVVLLDWRMPGISGIEVCKRIREYGINVPIILLTALSQISNKVEALRVGADDYITKPFSLEELIARIHAVVRRYKLHTNELITSNLTLNLIERKAITIRGEIPLNGKEFDLLKCFILHKGRILSKEELAKLVWGYDFVPLSNIIEVTVKNLRKKLEEGTGKKLIKSIYGEGYIFISE
ncbi:response regulator transcription factor [Melioribacteraceae bacterium 4301-Me]|uniref:response regulator transcription factor n=1 Tax=Pyranulibacter aquaticus TaxID=3163344 RepID=UPI00359690EA